MKITVHKFDENKVFEQGDYVETIDRKPYHRGFCGNFVPHYCRYKGKEYLLHGDLDYAYMHGHDESNVPFIVLVK